MKNKTLLWIITIILLATAVQGAITDNLVSYYNYTTNADDLLDFREGTINGGVTENANGVVG